jgi:hypothetical protein
MGVDSLFSESIRQRLNQRFRLGLPSSLLWERPNIAAVTAYVAELLVGSRQVAEEAA